jgi:hypothetical protein
VPDRGARRCPRCNALVRPARPWAVASVALMVGGAVTAGIGLCSGHQPVFETGASAVFVGLFGWMFPWRGRLVGEFRGCSGCGYDLAGITADACPECGGPVGNPARTSELVTRL